MNNLDHGATLTDPARNVLSRVLAEANQTTIGTEHLLLGLVREGEGVAALVLSNLGVGLDQVRSRVEIRIKQEDRLTRRERGLDITPAARLAIERLAIDEATRLHHPHIGTEHLLLGLLRVGEGGAATTLQSLGLTLEQVRAETLRILSQASDSLEVREEYAPDAPEAGFAGQRKRRLLLQPCHIAHVAPEKTPIGQKAQGSGAATVLGWVKVHKGGAFTLTLFHGMADDEPPVAVIADLPTGACSLLFRGLVHGLAYTLAGSPVSLTVFYCDVPSE